MMGRRKEESAAVPGPEENSGPAAPPVGWPRAAVAAINAAAPGRIPPSSQEWASRVRATDRRVLTST